MTSDADELEGRFPAGNANLCTSSLYYDALVSASYPCQRTWQAVFCFKRICPAGESIKKYINNYFGSRIEWFDSYRYYEGNDILRSWIAIPLTVGIFEKKTGTVEALFSPRLWSKDGLLTQAGTDTFWDRSTLYALRGVYSAGARERAMEHMAYYSQQRLLGGTCSISYRGLARRKPTAFVSRKCFVLPYSNRRYFWYSSDRI